MIGAGRILLFAIALGMAIFLLQWLIGGAMPSADSCVTPIALLVLGRLLVTTARAITRWVQRRMRWQLTLSHLAVILLTYFAIAAVGGAVVLGVIFTFLLPSPTGMAEATSRAMRSQVHGSNIDTGGVRAVAGAIVMGKVAVKGEFPLNLLGAPVYGPSSVLVADRSGRVLAFQFNRDQPRRCTDRLALPLPANVRRALSRSAALVRTIKITVTCRGRTLDHGLVQTRQQVIAATPLLSPAGRRVGVVAVQAPNYAPSAARIALAAFAAVSIVAILGVVVTSIPILAISSLFGYFLSRSFTQKLESISAAASALGAGDLNARTHVVSRNEIGRLGRDINLMADQLEATIAQLHEARGEAETALRARQSSSPPSRMSFERRSPF